MSQPGDPVGVAPPGVGHAPAQLVGAPLAGPLGDLARGEEERRARAGQSASGVGRRRLVPVGVADDHGVGQAVAQPVVHRRHDILVPGHVDEDGRTWPAIRRRRRRSAPRRRRRATGRRRRWRRDVRPTTRTPPARAAGGPDRRASWPRRSVTTTWAATEVVLVGQEVVDDERREEQRVEEHLQLLAVGAVRRVGRAPPVGCCRRRRAPARCAGTSATVGRRRTGRAR